MTKLELLIEEYKVLKTVINDSIKTQVNILGLGLTAISVVIGFGLNSWASVNLSIPKFLYTMVIPPLSSIILIIWLGELSRMVKISRYIVDLENEINAEFYISTPTVNKSEVLKWENMLWGVNSKRLKVQYFINYVAIVVLFLSFSILGIIMGLLHQRDNPVNSTLFILMVFFGFLWIIISVIILLKSFLSFKDAKGSLK